MVPPLPPLQSQNSVLSSNRGRDTPNFKNRQLNAKEEDTGKVAEQALTQEQSESQPKKKRQLQKSSSKNFEFDFGNESNVVTNLKNDISSKSSLWAAMVTKVPDSKKKKAKENPTLVKLEEQMGSAPKKTGPDKQELDKIIKSGYEVDAHGNKVKLSKQDLRLYKKTLVRMQIQEKLFA